MMYLGIVKGLIAMIPVEAKDSRSHQPILNQFAKNVVVQPCIEP